MHIDGDIVALDISARRTGLARGRPGAAPTVSSIAFAQEDDEPEDVYGRAVFWIAEYLRTSRPALIVIEAPVPAFRLKGFTNNNTIQLLNGLYAAIAGCIRCKGIPVRRAQIRTVRKHFLGNGGLPGDQAKRAAIARCRQLGWPVTNDDEADAAAIWDWACSTYGRTMAGLAA